MRKYNPRPYKAYLIRDRYCCKCGSNRTSDNVINHVMWHRDRDENGESTGRWKCHKCYMKDYQKRRKEMAGIIDPNNLLTTKKDENIINI